MFAWVCIFVSASACGFVTAQPAVGAPVEVPLTRKVLTVAAFAVKEFNKANDAGPFRYHLLKITSAKTQVVEGINYILDVQLAPTCKSQTHGHIKKGQTTISAGVPCELAKPKVLTCHFVVTEVPWIYSRVLSQNKCE